MVDQNLARPRACVECAKAKAKCSLDSESSETSICDRCSRLSKQCTTQVFQARKRRRQAKNDSEHPPQSSPTSNGMATVNVLRGDNAPNHRGSLSTPAGVPEVTLDGPQRPDYTTSLGRSKLLAYYRKNMEINFPFVVLPDVSHTAALELERPFVCKTAILAAINKDVDAALELEDGILRDIAERVFVQGERNLDLLQGLLILIGFYHYHTRISKQITTLTQLAVSILADMGLNRLEPQRSNFEAQLRDGKLNPPAFGAKNHEERRAVCGCYYLASIMAGFFHRSEAMKDTPSLDWCCNMLDSQPEHESDRYVVHLVRLQQIRQRVATQLSTERLFGNVEFNEATVAAISSFRSALTECKRSAPMYIMNQSALRMHYLALELLFSEAALTTNFSPSTANPCITAQRVKLLTSGLYIIRSFIDIWFSMPPAQVYDLTCATQFEGAMAIITLYKISNLSFPGWDAQEARTIIELGTLIEELQACFERARLASGVTDERHVFSRTIKPLVMFKQKSDKGLEDGSDAMAPDVLGSVDFANFELDTMLGFELGSWDLLQSM